MTEKSRSTFSPDPYDVVEYFRDRGQSFARIARELPFWREDDPTKRPLTGRELKQWFEHETARRSGQ